MNQNSKKEKLLNFLRWQKRSLNYYLFRNNKAITNTKYSEEVVFIASMGRSGSTWLSEIINASQEYRELFEPFKAEMVEEAKIFQYPLFLDKSFESDRHYLAANKIITGRFTSIWTDIEDYSKTLPKKLLIKDIFVNFFLHWLYKKFPKTKIILLIRHPYSCIESWLRCNFSDGLLEKEYILRENSLKKYLPKDSIEHLEKTKNSFERVVCLWCVYYYIPLIMFKYEEILVVFYEALKRNTKNEVERIYDYLEQPFSLKSLTNLTKPSRTATKKNYFDNNHGLDQNKINYINETLRIFTLDKIYENIDTPNLEEVRKFMRK